MTPIAEAAEADAAPPPVSSPARRRRRIGLVIALVVTSFSFTANNQKTMIDIRATSNAYPKPRNNISFASNALRSSSKILGNNATGPQADEDDGEESFSACLLVMDDNHRLVEWLAYHYYALPLRHLVVAVDPHSKTRPDPILDRWRSRMTIEVWSDSDFTAKNLIINQTIDKPGVMLGKHRKRQNAFYHQCIRHMQKAGRRWTAFIDVDEFLTINGHNVKNSDVLVGQPGNILQLVQKYSTPNNKNTWDQPEIRYYKHFQQSCCVTFPRKLYSAKESTFKEVKRGFPPALEGEFDARRFDTLRYRYRAGSFDGLGKSIIDVARVEKGDFNSSATAHKPLKLCPSTALKYNALPLGIHHYLGSFASYSFREDARKGYVKTYDDWKNRSSLAAGGADDTLRPWIAGFVKLVGEEEARRLLRDAGLPLDYKKSQEETQSWAQVPGSHERSGVWASRI